MVPYIDLPFSRSSLLIPVPELVLLCPPRPHWVRGQTLGNSRMGPFPMWGFLLQCLLVSHDPDSVTTCHCRRQLPKEERLPRAGMAVIVFCIPFLLAERLSHGCSVTYPQGLFLLAVRPIQLGTRHFRGTCTISLLGWGVISRTHSKQRMRW